MSWGWWQARNHLEVVFPRHWANLYSSLNGLVTWCPNLFSFWSTDIKMSFHVMISGVVMFPILSWKQLLLWIALIPRAPQFLWLLWCARTQAVPSVFSLQRRAGSPAGAVDRQASERCGTPQYSWPSGGLAVSDCQTSLLKWQLFTKRRWNIQPEQGQGAAQSLTKGSGGRALYLARNYSRDSIALHSNGRLIDRS